MVGEMKNGLMATAESEGDPKRCKVSRNRVKRLYQS